MARSKTAKKTAASAEPKPEKTTGAGAKRATRSRKTAARQVIRCYLCGHHHEVSARTMSTTCPGCHKAIKVEDVQIKSYLPVNDLQTCGQIKVTRRGRVAARNIQSGKGVICEGSLEGSIETQGTVQLGPKSSWRGPILHSRTLAVADGATLVGHVVVPWDKDEEAAADASD